MKRIGLYLSGLFLSVVCLTSCMEGGNVWEGIVFGVVDFKVMQPIVKTSSGDLYSSSLNSMIKEGDVSIGDCIALYIRIDSDLPENSTSAVESYGYRTVTILQHGKIPRYSLNSYLTDTTRLLIKEVPVVKGFNDFADFVAGNFFMSQVVNIPEDWVLDWNMSYDAATMMPTEEGGKRYYDLYLRATVSKQGEKNTKIDRELTTAFTIGGYLSSVANIEKSYLGSNYNNASKFTLRFNFISSIDETTNAITWKSNQIDIDVAAFLSNTYY